MPVNADKLLSELIAAGLPVVSAYPVRRVEGGDRSTHHADGGGALVRLDWSADPTPERRASAVAVILAHTPTPPVDERQAAALAANPRALLAIFRAVRRLAPTDPAIAAIGNLLDAV